jgi:hypothetical protein
LHEGRKRTFFAQPAAQQSLRRRSCRRKFVSFFLLFIVFFFLILFGSGLWKMGAPFAADIVDGFVVGRGTQDMKSVCVQHLVCEEKKSAFSSVSRVCFVQEAVSRLGSLKRTVHLTFVPDEEIGGAGGMSKFVEQGHLKNLNVGFALDEGLANPKPNQATVFYGKISFLLLL